MRKESVVVCTDEEVIGWVEGGVCSWAEGEVCHDLHQRKREFWVPVINVSRLAFTLLDILR